MSTTRWKDTITRDIDNAIDLLIDEVEVDDGSTFTTYSNWSLNKVFETNQNFEIREKKYSFNYISYKYDQFNKGDVQPLKKQGFIITYTDGNDVFFIIDQNSSAQKILRKLLSYTGRNELVKEVPAFTSDFFIWLIKRVFTSKNKIDAVDEHGNILSLEAIKGFRGNTEDLQNKITASGESVMNLISTLSFLLESKQLDQVKIDIAYPPHENISLKIQQGILEVDTPSYHGPFETDEQCLKISKLYLLVYLEIIPLLKQEYNSNKEDNLWNETVYKSFTKMIASKIADKIGALNFNDDETLEENGEITSDM